MASNLLPRSHPEGIQAKFATCSISRWARLGIPNMHTCTCVLHFTVRHIGGGGGGSCEPSPYRYSAISPESISIPVHARISFAIFSASPGPSSSRRRTHKLRPHRLWCAQKYTFEGRSTSNYNKVQGQDCYWSAWPASTLTA